MFKTLCFGARRRYEVDPRHCERIIRISRGTHKVKSFVCFFFPFLIFSLSDKYGNYCLQTALTAIQNEPELVAQFVESLKPHLETLVTIAIFFSFFLSKLKSLWESKRQTEGKIVCSKDDLILGIVSIFLVGQTFTSNCCCFLGDKASSFSFFRSGCLCSWIWNIVLAFSSLWRIRKGCQVRPTSIFVT